ncbi:M4 family metallopeptidase [Archangium violaceum]|uniref:Peptidase M4 n=1 Tax=Archangium violaceum Cb vi76 TaxID=1406225 RepID=A0A084SU07_9BACT|nr:M4 family metallopeptidase [Archangium violaceum]KFA91942.1 peptidase M4 [Archangium violaceum Cb vi76]
MSNRFVRTFCVAWLGASLAACGSMQEGEAPVQGGDDADIQAALARVQGARVLGTDDGVPYAVKGQFGRASQAAGLRAQPDVRGALSLVAPVFRLNENDLVFRRATVDAQGHQHLRFQQTKNGLRVVGGELVMHVDAAGNVYAANGSARDGSSASSVAKVSPEAARVAAVENTTARIATTESAELVYLRSEGSSEPRLAYEVRLKGERDGMPVHDLVYVDAQRGGILLVNPLIHDALNRKVYSANNGSSTPGTLKRSEGQAPIGDAHVDMNYDMLGATYNCYQTLFGRDSYDNAGATLISTVHYGSNYVNAYWDGTQMVYGDGNNSDSIELGKDLDVTVHELTHAVTDTESDLIYSGESGGLNESMSDIFAGVCESWTRNWAVDADVFMIGEDIWTPGTPNDALRYMDDPAKDDVSLDFYGDYSSGVDVHYSSGISNLVFSLLSKGGVHPRGKSTNVVPAIGPEKAGRIFYKANTDLFTASTTFEQAKTYTLQAAEALYGAGSAEASAVNEAWKAVGVPPPPPVVNPLTNGVPVSSLSGSSGNKKYYSLEVPAGQTSLTFEISGGTGDADLYVRNGAVPSASTYDCRPYASGNAESCPFPNPAAGTWYVMLNAYSAYSGVTLKGTYGGGSGGGGGGTPVSTTASGTVAKNKNNSHGPYNVVAGTTFKVVMTGTRDPNLYVRFGAAPTTSAYDCRPALSGASETCELTVPAGQSTAHIMVRGAGSGTASYNLAIDYTQP